MNGETSSPSSGAMPLFVAWSVGRDASPVGRPSPYHVGLVTSSRARNLGYGYARFYQHHGASEETTF